MNPRKIAQQLRPSSSKRWLSCTASPVLMAESSWSDKPSKYAEEGTEAHEWAADALEESPAVLNKLQDAEMKKYVSDYVDFVQSRIGPNDTVYIEQPLTLFFAKKVSISGTTDVGIIYGNGETVDVIDLKYGKGVYVAAKDNTQLIIYVLSLIETNKILFNFTPETLVRIIVYQPRMKGKPTVKVASYRLRDLQQRARFIEDTATSIINEPNFQAFRPSDENCKWCPVKGQCKAYAGYMLNGVPEIVPVGRITDNNVASILERRTEIINWLNKVNEYAYERLQAGYDIPGLKLKPGNNLKRWDEEKAQELAEFILMLLKNHGWTHINATKDLLLTLTPNNVEKFIEAIEPENKTLFSRFITIKKGKESVAFKEDGDDLL